MTSSKWLIDTDILIDYLRGIQSASKYLEHVMNNSMCFISVITIAELYVGVKEGKERTILEHFVQKFEIAPLNEKVAERGGLYRRDYGKSHGVGLADALIAATAEELDIKLATLNLKHYPMLRNIHVPYHK